MAVLMKPEDPDKTILQVAFISIFCRQGAVSRCEEDGGCEVSEFVGIKEPSVKADGSFLETGRI
ncbi:MAG: hypothetical protein AB1393_12445 [Candidatus Edwardsbacteria bacterium]